MQKIAHDAPAGRSSGHGDARSGFLAGYPAVGSPLVFFADSPPRRIITSRVRSVSVESPTDTLRIETENSLYRIAIDGPRHRTTGESPESRP